MLPNLALTWGDNAPELHTLARKPAPKFYIDLGGNALDQPPNNLIDRFTGAFTTSSFRFGRSNWIQLPHFMHLMWIRQAHLQSLIFASQFVFLRFIFAVIPASLWRTTKLNHPRKLLKVTHDCYSYSPKLSCMKVSVLSRWRRLFYNIT